MFPNCVVNMLSFRICHKDEEKVFIDKYAAMGTKLSETTAHITTYLKQMGILCISLIMYIKIIK